MGAFDTLLVNMLIIEFKRKKIVMLKADHNPQTIIGYNDYCLYITHDRKNLTLFKKPIANLIRAIYVQCNCDLVSNTMMFEEAHPCV
jgi:hypothetical protein